MPLPFHLFSCDKPKGGLQDYCGSFDSIDSALTEIARRGLKSADIAVQRDEGLVLVRHIPDEIKTKAGRDGDA